MFKDAFIKLEGEEAKELLSRVNPLQDGAGFDVDNVSIMTHDLSFYPGYKLVELVDHEAVPVRRKFAVSKGDDVVILNWTNEPIYQLNSRVPISLSEQTVLNYARFFFMYVRGRHGRFLICETVDDINWKEEPPPAARKAVGKMLEPLYLKDMSDDGTYNLDARMIFKDSLFRSAVHVRPDGMVSLSDEELLIEDMPVLDDTFGQ